MKLLPGLQSIEQGQAQPVPFSFKPFLLPWMKAEYKRYDFGFALMQEFINKKFNVFSWRLHIETATRMYPVTDRPVIALQFTLEGSMPVRNNGLQEKQARSAGFELQYIPKRVHEIWFEPGRYEFLYIEINPGYLEDLADTDAGIGEILKSMKHSAAMPVSHVSVPINYITSAILDNLHTCNDRSGNLRLELQKYILELLSEYLHEMEEADKDRCLGPVAHKRQMMAIKAGVMQSPNINEQSLERLSRKHGISMTAMKLDFKALFGFTLAAYVRFHALTKAHYLIVSTNRPIDDIGSEVGYSYRTNFNQAFKKQFHYLPGQLREKKDTVLQVQQL